MFIFTNVLLELTKIYLKSANKPAITTMTNMEPEIKKQFQTLHISKGMERK